MRRLGEELANAPPQPVEPRSRKERLVQRAQGHPDRADVRAAQNICKKYGWVYEKGGR